MAYIKSIWEDEVLSGEELFNIKQSDNTPIESNVKIQLATAITTPGTVVNAAKMNNIEEGIEDLATGVARSVKGVAGASAGAVADISAGTDGHVLRRSGTGIGFGTIATAGVANAAITAAKTSFIKQASASFEVYFGRVSNYSTSGDILPSGWTRSAASSNNEVTVTHLLGTTNYIVIATPWYEGSQPTILNITPSSNSVVLRPVNTSNNVINTTIDFIVIKL